MTVRRWLRDPRSSLWAAAVWAVSAVFWAMSGDWRVALLCGFIALLNVHIWDLRRSA